MTTEAQPLPPLPTDDIIYQVVPLRVARSIERMAPEVLRLTRLCDGVRTLAAVGAESSFEVDVARELLRGLEHMGLVERSGSVRRASPAGAAVAWANGRWTPQSVAAAPRPSSPFPPAADLGD